MIVYEYPKCSTCKKALKWLDNNNINYEKIDIVKTPPIAKHLIKWIDDNELKLTEVFNTSGKKYRELNLKEKLPTMSIKEACEDYLSKDGMLIKRPILVQGEKVVFGFNEEKVGKLIGN